MHRRIGRILAWVVGVWVLVVLALSALAARDLGEARRIAGRAERSSPDDLRSGRLANQLSEVGHLSGRASDLLSSPPLLPVRVVPVVGRQLAVIRAIATAGKEVATSGLAVVDATSAAVDGPPATGPDRVTDVRSVRETLVRAERVLAAVDLGPGNALVGPVADARNDVAAKLTKVQDGLQQTIAITGTLSKLLEGPQRYLLLVCNNAEMRSGSGIPLSIGTLDTRAGTFELGDLQPAGELLLDTPIDVPGDIGERWGFTRPGQEWRSLGMSPRFDANAQLASRLWEARTGEVVDGVMAVDIATLRAIVDATGPVRVGEQELEGEALEEFLMNDQYEAFDAVRDGDQSERREALGGVARQAVQRLQGGEGDTEALLRNLTETAEGRHLLAWARDPEAQDGWIAAGLDGRLTERSLLVALVNRGENKLDHFVELTHRMRVTSNASGVDVEIVTGIDNTTPGDEPNYVAGPVAGLTDAAGTYLGLLSANVPGAATAISLSIDGVPCPLSAAGADGPTRVAACPVTVAARTEQEVVLRFHLPAGADVVLVEPSARIDAARWHYGDRTFRDTGRTVLDLSLQPTEK